MALYNSYQSQQLDNLTTRPLTDKRLSYPSASNIQGSDANAWRLRGIDFGIRLKRLRAEIFSPDCWKLSIPAILYVIQNSGFWNTARGFRLEGSANHPACFSHTDLQFVAASNLDVATFQVSYQMKILTTALFSVVLLKRRLTLVKWLSLVFLAIGVAIVQLQAVDSSASASTPNDRDGSSKDSHAVEMDPVVGSMAVAAACLTSGLAGVYFEMVLKGSKADLWIRNVQLSTFSLLPALFPVFFPAFSLKSLLGYAPQTPAPLSEAAVGSLLSPLSLLDGFGFWAWSVVFCQVFGGLVTALVIKFADNILKVSRARDFHLARRGSSSDLLQGFATSLSIVLSFFAGVILFDSQLTLGFVVGCSIVLASTYAYNLPAKPVPPAKEGRLPI